MFTSAPIPSTKRRISAKSEGMLNMPYAGPMMLTLGFAPGARSRSAGTFFGPNSVHNHHSARLALCH